MNNRVNYTVVGIFVIIVTTLFFLSLYWIIRPTNTQEVKVYGLLATESITGVNIGTNVKYQGVDIGRVKNFKINPNKLNEIMIYLEISRETPIQNGVMASIKPQGITGLSFIDIQVMPNATKLKEMNFMGKKYTIIPFKISTLSNLTNSAEEVSKKLQTVLDKISKFLDHNEKDTDVIIHQLSLSTQQFNKLLSDKNINNISSLLSETNQLVTKTQKLLDTYTLVGKEGQKTLEKINSSIDNGDYNLKKISGPLPHESAELIKELRILTRELSSTIQDFQNNPSEILFKSSAPNPGPGEK